MRTRTAPRHATTQPRHLGANRVLHAYLDNVTAKTGKTPEEFVKLANAEGLLDPGVKAGQIVRWLKEEYGLGRGHAIAIVSIIQKQTRSEPSADEKVTRHFAGKKSDWRPVYEDLIAKVSAFSPDIDIAPAASYLSLRKAGKKFAILKVTAERLDIGIKLKGTPPDGRLEDAGAWNRMVTHRVRIRDPREIDQELVAWLADAHTHA